MNRPVYSLLLYLAVPFFFARLLWRARKSPDYLSRWKERLAWYPTWPAQDERPILMIHAVSVGEVHASVPLIRAWLAQHPDKRVLITCSTPTGSARVRDLFGNQVEHVYLPLDLPGATKRFLERFRPALLLVMETELWPNLIHQARERGAEIVLANARLSEKSCRGYAKFPALARPMLEALTLVAAQSQADAERFQRLGIPESRCRIMGSMKYDMALNAMQIATGRELRARYFSERPVLVAASTREGEEALVLSAYQAMLTTLPSLGLVLVPRHPERFDEVFALCHAQGLKVARRSADLETAIVGQAQVLLGDSMGELQMYYAMGDLAFVGGSLVPTGCQNILEPAALALPIVTGPSLYNFQAVSEALSAAGAMVVVKDPQGLAEEVTSILSRPERRQAMSAAAEQVFAAHGGASHRLLALIETLPLMQGGQRVSSGFC